MTTSQPDDDSSPPADAENAGDLAATDRPPDSLAEEGLPEWEPLSPELVEDEAIRGDFVMRWAVVGLAILLGCTAIAESKTLVYLRSGQYLAQHGVLPPATDYLAFTRAGQPWINLSWLFDLLSAGVHRLGGGIALSLFQGLAAAVTFGLLVHTVRPEIRTWWGSICAAFALLACFHQFTIQPELITLLGTAITLWLLISAVEGTVARSAWALVGVIWLWSQLDPRAFFGWSLLLLYGAGEFFGSLCGRPGFRDVSDRRRFWLISAVSVLAAGIHPFLGQPWSAPWRLYFLEYPAWRAAYVEMTRAELMFHPAARLEYWADSRHLTDLHFWHGLTIGNLAAIYLALAAMATMALNRQRTPIAHLALFLGANIAALAAGHELALASLVNCVLATLNAQEWYATTFGQHYSTQWNVLLFSRGGRAVTVFGLATIGFLAISGRIDGPNGKRTGLGFDPALAGQMSGYEQALADSFDDRPFSFVVRQGDLLIWAGQKSFIDSRLELFQRGSNVDLIALHHKTRLALRRESADLPGSGQRPFWRQVFKDYQMTHAVPRLSGLSLPTNYRTFDDLAGSTDWKLTRLTAPAAVFYCANLSKDDALKSYVNHQKLSLTDLAFRQETSQPDEVQDWPVVSTSYQRILSLPRDEIPDATTTAGNFLHYASKENLSNSDRLGAAYAAVRSARTGLRDNPHHAEGYLALGAAYNLINQLERLEAQRQNKPAADRLRYHQAVSAWQSAALLQPGHPLPQQELASLYLQRQRWDLALKHLTEFLKQTDSAGMSEDDDAKRRRAQLEEMNQQLTQRVTAVQAQAYQQISSGGDRSRAAIFAEQNGALMTAIDIVDANRVALVQDPRLQLAFSGWLLEAGRAEEVSELLSSLERFPGMTQQTSWRDCSASVAWTRGDYARAIDLETGTVASLERAGVEMLLFSGPFSASSPAINTDARYPWAHALAAQDVGSRRSTEVGERLLKLAIYEIEQGDLAAAEKTLQQAFEQVPDTPFRPLLSLYWSCLKNETPELDPPREESLDVPEVFSDDE
ncbi:MAG: hypothetical protein U0872_09390 [Planctomycetaceae bacterium]